jgi:hypothetical protein
MPHLFIPPAMMQAFLFDIGLLLVAYLGRLLKNAHLLRFSHPSSLRSTSKYASLLRISRALHLGIFEQPEENPYLLRK